MVPYKKIDLIVESFTQMPDKRLIVIGDGPEFNKIKSKAGKNVTLLGYQSFSVLKDHMQRAKAFVFAAEEDFGITVVEAQACGTPVIALGKGGALETIIPLGSKNPTGIFFFEQKANSLIDVIGHFEENIGIFLPHNCRKNAEKYSVLEFCAKFTKFINKNLEVASTQNGVKETLLSLN